MNLYATTIYVELKQGLYIGLSEIIQFLKASIISIRDINPLCGQSLFEC